MPLGPWRQSRRRERQGHHQLAGDRQEALEYAKQLYEAWIPGTASWNDAFNNKAFLAEEIWLTNNGVSIYAAAKKGANPRGRCRCRGQGRGSRRWRRSPRTSSHSVWPVGPVGKPTEFHICYPLLGMKYSPNPNAVKAFMQFLMEAENFGPWAAAAVGYLTQTLNAYENLPFWSRGPEGRNGQARRRSVR